MTRQQRIQEILSHAFAPTYLEVIDESYMHHHRGDGSHVKIIMACQQFEGMTLINRHRELNNRLADEFNQGLHALSMHLYTPIEWEKRQSKPSSPPCHHQPSASANKD